MDPKKWNEVRERVAKIIYDNFKDQCPDNDRYPWDDDKWKVVADRVMKEVTAACE